MAEMRRAQGGLGLLGVAGRAVSDKLGPEAGRAGLTGLASTGCWLSLASRRSCFSGQKSKKIVIFDKNGPMELDADKPQGPPDRILGQPTWVGGGGRLLVGESLFGEEI